MSEIKSKAVFSKFAVQKPQVISNSLKSHNSADLNVQYRYT